MSLVRKVKGYLLLIRPHNLVATVITTMIGWLSVATVAHANTLNPVIPVATVVLVAAGGYVINDYFDAEVDAVNKAYRPIPSGAVSRREALTLSIVLGVAGVALAVISGPLTLTFAALNSVLVYLYSYKIKEWGFIGNIVVAFEGAASILYGALALSEYLTSTQLIMNSFIPALYAFLLLLAREVVKTIEDYKADELRNVKSLPRVLGIKAASVISVALLLVVVAISPIPYFIGYGVPYILLALVTDAIICYSVVKLLKLPYSHAPERIAANLRSYLKAAIFAGSLAFLIDLVIRFLSAFYT